MRFPATVCRHSLSYSRKKKQTWAIWSYIIYDGAAVDAMPFVHRNMYYFFLF